MTSEIQPLTMANLNMSDNITSLIKLQMVGKTKLSQQYCRSKTTSDIE